MRKRSIATRNLIGYWHEEPGCGYSHPQPLVSPAWETARRSQIVEYLQAGYAYRAGGGLSYCRFGCTSRLVYLSDSKLHAGYPGESTSRAVVNADGSQETEIHYFCGYYVKIVEPTSNGCYECCDDVWIWPEGLAHYVEMHGIRLPDEFVAHAAARDFQPMTDAPPFAKLRISDRFWREWCKANAPFEPEPHCLACAPPSLE